MKKHSLLAFLVVAFLSLPFLGCHHHHHGGGGSVSPPSRNPAAYTYTATEVAHHQPGFFSCAWHNGKLFLGTYQDYDSKGHCQLCTLEGDRVRVLRTLDGESIYNIRSYDGYLMLPVEQGALWSRNDDGSFTVVQPKYLHMGHYDFQWTPHGWVTSQKEGITSQNKSQLWLQDRLLLESSEYTWKEFVVKGDFLFVAAYFIHKRTEGGLLRVNAQTGENNLVYSQQGTACYTIGIDCLGRVIYGLQHGATTTIRDETHPFQEVPDIAWRIRTVGDATFLLAAEHGWRKDGPSYLYVLNTSTGKFDLKCTIRDAEPWDITSAGSDGVYYLVTRNEHERNLGRVYLVRRSK